jgi:diguanylate cyclase (GGDEF)-like protein
MLAGVRRYHLRVNLRPRFLLLSLLFFVVVAAPSWWAVRTLADGIMAQWAVRYAEKQALYDKSRTLQPILREVALSRQLAQSRALRDWAQDPQNAALQAVALDELESYRLNFQDRSYFVALLKNGHYYHNNAANEYAGREFRYVLDPKAAKDVWFFDLVRQQRDLHINVNPDFDLGITKLWIDVLIREGDAILGMTGTGLDLSHFIREVVVERQPGVTSLFVDHAGAIQLHRDQSLIDFGSVAKNGSERKTLDLLFNRPQDRAEIQAAMKVLETQPGNVETRFLTLQGQRHLAAVVYLPEIDWYQITLLNLDVLLPLSEFSLLLLTYLLTIGGTLLLFTLALQRYVLRPLRWLDEGMTALEAGRTVDRSQTRLGTGEIGQVLHRFATLAQAVQEARRELEAKVQERTQALAQLTQTDPLTGLLNRRGMTERLQTELARNLREGQRLGILWLDVDHFKSFNDRHGHAVGDRVLQALAGVIGQTIRPYDAAARWGGDEFLVMMSSATQATLDQLGERLLQAVAACTSVSDADGQVLPLRVSIGGHLASDGDDLESVLHHGDEALYKAKQAGRATYRASRGPGQ